MLGATLAARLPSLWEPRWSAGEGVLAATGWEMDKGQLLYVQVWNGAQPLANAWMALVVGVTRGWHPGMQLFLAAQALAATALVWAIARRLGGAAAPAALVFGLALALPVTTGDVQGTETIGLPLLAGAVLLGIGGGPARAVAAGGLAVAAALAHPAYLLDGLAIPWYAALSGRPLRLLPVLGGAAAAALLAALVMSVAGCWAYYGPLLDNGRALLWWANGGPELAPITLAVRLVPLGVALFAGLRIGLEQDSPAARLLGAWLPLAAIGAVANPLGAMHQALELLPPLCLLLGLWLRWALVAPVLVGVVVALQFAMFLPRLEMFLLARWPVPAFQAGTAYGWERLPGYERAWYDRAIGLSTWDAYAGTFPNRPAEQERLAAAMTVQGRLAVWGDLPWLYVEGDRVQATRFVAHDLAYDRLPDGASQSVAGIRQERPEYLVVSGAAPRDLQALIRSRYDRLRFLPGPWTTYGLHSG